MITMQGREMSGKIVNWNSVKNNFPKKIRTREVLNISDVSDICFIVFSACGGIRTGNGMPVLAAYFPVLAYGILGKGGLFVALSLEDCLTGLSAALLFKLEQVVPIYSLSVAVWRLPDTDLTEILLQILLNIKTLKREVLT